MKRFVLGPAADRDLLDLFRHGIRTFGAHQAAAYHDEILNVMQLIADFPELARERAEYRPPIRIHRHNRHYVVYRAVKDHVRILRVLRDEADLGRHLRRLR